jgi:outer membrane receptor protein involved in Fe transport
VRACTKHKAQTTAESTPPCHRATSNQRQPIHTARRTAAQRQAQSLQYDRPVHDRRQPAGGVPADTFGEKANLLEPLDGFAVVNLSARYALARHVAVTARVTNLFGSDYSTFGLLGEVDDVLGDEYDDPRFLSPGAPRAAWVGLQFSFR